MTKIRAFVGTVLVLMVCSSLLAFAQSNPTAEMSVLYDPKLKTPRPKLEPTLIAQIVKDLRSFPVFKDMRTDVACRGETWDSAPVLATAKGSFTRVKSDQTVYMVEPCIGPIVGDVTPTAVMVYEQGKLISAFRFSSNTIYTGLREGFGVRDIDQNGLSELALVTFGGDACADWTYLDLIQWASAKPISLGSLNVARNDCGKSTGYTVYVNKNSKPTFVGVEAARNLKLALLELGKPSMTITALK